MKQEQEIFEQAIALPSREARDGFLLKACGENRQLRGSVDELLAAFSDAGALDFLHTGGHAEGKETILESPLDEGPGTLIGRYKLLQEIGEGGCGVVYMAEQEEPVRRRVALKVIKLGMDTKSVIARFEAERQALALMDHPNIARVLDAGATDAGLPYFVMELVRGIKITEYCDQNNLSTRDRLDLFIKVCQAIQHAHQKGIIHRDIKPSNILVTLHDGVPVPKVIDFGIAKATSDQRLTDKTLFTALEQFVGTPAYMSPEQAEMSGLDIDTRCDIYSLGVLLYEMLTGQTPFDAKELLASGLDKMRRTIREQEPVRPSTRLNTMLEGELTATARHRQTDAPKLVHLLRGDVDWIVMKCLEKDRTRRYETASGLASDLHRHLNNEAVLARPPSATYRFQKLVRRNKLAFAAAAAIATVLVLGVIVSTWQMVRATQAKKDAVEQRQAADNNAGKARQAEQKAERAAATVTRNLYFAEMNLAGNAAAEPGGISRVADLTAKWIPENGNIDQRGWEWSYLRSLLHQDLFTLRGHTQDVTSVVWSPDGTRLASGSADNTIKIWDIASRQAILVLIGHTGEVNAVSWSPDGKYLSSCGEDKTIKIWDATNGREIGTLHGHTNGVKSVAWSPDGTRLASGSDDGTVKVWNANSGAIVTQIEHSNGVLSVAWSPDGKRLASGDHDRTIKIWDATSGQVIYTLSGHNDGRVAVSWSPDGKRLASGGADFMVRIWDAVARTNLNTLVGHLGVVKSVLWSPDGHFLASASTDGTIKIWDAANGRPINIVRGHMGHVNTAAWSPDGKFLASGSRDHTIKVWDATTEETLTLRGHTGNVWSVAWSPDGKRLASASYDNSVKIWDPDSGQESRTLSGHTDEVNSVAWSPDGKHLASSSDDNTIKIWDAASGQEALATLAGHRASIMTVAWSPDGKRLASASGDGTAKVWDMTSMRETRTFRAHSNAVHSVSWSPDGKLLASGSWDQTVKIWDPESGREVRTLNRPSGQEVTLVRWSPDGKRLAAASFDGTSTVWDAVSGQIIHTMRGHSGGVVSVSWSPDGKRLASGSSDNAIKIWDAASGQEILTLRGHTLNVQSVSWSPDGKRLASGSYDHTVKIWDARKGYALERE